MSLDLRRQTKRRCASICQVAILKFESYWLRLASTAAYGCATHRNAACAACLAACTQGIATGLQHAATGCVTATTGDAASVFRHLALGMAAAQIALKNDLAIP
jgi:hypothetical protein